MKLEHYKQPVKSTRGFILRMIRYSCFALTLVGISVAIGSIGYHSLASMDWIDSFHMACLILTGMGPVVEMKTTTAKLFSSFYALYSGVAFLSITAVFFAPLIHRILHILSVDIE